MTTRPYHPFTAAEGALSEFGSDVDQLSSTFAALKRQHGHERATFSLAATLLDKDNTWLTVHLAVAIAILDDRAPASRQ